MVLVAVPAGRPRDDAGQQIDAIGSSELRQTRLTMSAQLYSPIFIVGPHRAGSTLWHNVIAMSPTIMRIAEPRFLASPGHRDFAFFLRTQAHNLSTNEGIDKVVDLCFSKKPVPGLEGAFWRFEGIEVAQDPRLKQNIAHGIKESDRSIGAIARVLIAEITALSGYARACVKFPVEVSYIPDLVRWFPDCKIVHITRDPRALAMSKTNDPSGTAITTVRHPRLAWLIKKASVWITISRYRLAARLHVRFKRMKNYRLFRYEDLLAEPEKTLRELCAFIDTEFVETMLAPQKGRHEHQPSSLTGKRQKAFDPCRSHAVANHYSAD